MHSQKKYLFEPLGIKQYRWIHINSDMVYTSGDLRLRPRDMAKIGFLLLNDGVWESNQIVSSEWIAKSIHPSVRFNSKQGYGFQWWIKDYELGNSSIHSFAAMGWGGQNIIALPSLNAVVVVTAGNYARPSPNDEITKEFFEAQGFNHIETIIRNIPNKRMPLKNSPSNITGKTDITMKNEYIVVMQKSI